MTNATKCSILISVGVTLGIGCVAIETVFGLDGDGWTLIGSVGFPLGAYGLMKLLGWTTKSDDTNTESPTSSPDRE